jgi:hypothetical protein
LIFCRRLDPSARRAADRPGARRLAHRGRVADAAATLAAIGRCRTAVFTVNFLYPIRPLEALRRLFATIFALMALPAACTPIARPGGTTAAAYAYAAGAIGVSFAGDLISLFLFWELMALFSTSSFGAAARPAPARPVFAMPSCTCWWVI